MTRDDLTREWQREAELYAYLGYVSPRNQPTPPKPAGSVLDEKLNRFSKDDMVLQQIRELHKPGRYHTVYAMDCEHGDECQGIRCEFDNDKYPQLFCPDHYIEFCVGCDAETLSYGINTEDFTRYPCATIRIIEGGDK